jgi:hypothetical protein
MSQNQDKNHSGRHSVQKAQLDNNNDASADKTQNEEECAPSHS